MILNLILSFDKHGLKNLAAMLKEIGVDSESKEIGTDAVETDDYYSRYFSQTPRMVTNKGCIDIKNSNIDVVQIIQKG